MGNRILAFGGYFSLLTYGLTVTIAGPALDSIRADFAVSSGQVGFLFTALSIGFISAVILAGYLINKFSLKSVSVMGQFVLTLGLMLFSFSNSIKLGSISFFLIGIGGGLIELATNTLIATLFHKNRASSLNLLHLFFGFGALAGPLISGYLIQTGLEWRIVFQVVSAFSLIILLLLVFLTYPEGVSTGSKTASSTFKLMKSRYMILVCLAVVLYVGIEMAINSWSVIYMEHHLNMEKLTASSFLSYFWIMMTFGRMLCAYLGDKIKSHNLLILLLLLACGAYPLFIFSSNSIIIGIALALVGLSFSGIFPILIALNSNRFSNQIGTSTSILMTFMGVGLMIFPWATGIIADILSLQWSMRILTGALLLLMITAILIRKLTLSEGKQYET